MKAPGHLGRALMETVFPAKCAGCGELFHARHPPEPASDFGQLMGPFLCKDCCGTYSPVRPPLCPVCGSMYEAREDEDENHPCEACIRSGRVFRRARAAGIFDSALKTVIHGLKYTGKIQLARPLGRLLLGAFCQFWDKGGVDLLVPVPLHMARFRQRGFNQAYLLIRRWAALSRQPDSPLAGVRIARRAIRRVRRTLPQTGLGIRGRRNNMRGAFRLTGEIPVTGRRILLVDDVLTTGATAEECARVLMEGGARHVDVLTLARAL